MTRSSTERVARAGEAVARGLRYLESVQRPDGALPSNKWHREGVEIFDVVGEEAVCPTLVMAMSLSRVPEAEPIMARILDFIERHQEPAGVWHYLTRADPFHDSLAPDVDDTAMASVLLRRYGRKAPNNRRLLLSNRAVDGQFYTWIIAQGRWWLSLGRWRILAGQLPHRERLRDYYNATPGRATDIDPGVNANVLLYLGARPDDPLAHRLLDIVRMSRTDAARWYSDPFMLWYLISRALAPIMPAAGPIFVERVTSAEPQSAVQLSGATCVLLDWHAAVPDAWIDALTDTQGQAGEWPRFPIFTDYESDEEWGGEAYSAALCVEALARWSQAVTVATAH